MPVPSVRVLEKATAFLDLDGTLLDLAERPDDVRADTRTRALLMELARKLEGRLAIVSGRSLAQIDDILGDVSGQLSVSGSHGCELRWNGVLARPFRPPSLDVATVCMRLFAKDRPGVLVEEKSFGIALHYRMSPESQAGAHQLCKQLSDELDLTLQHGKMVVELRVAGGDKGRAVRRMMSRAPMEGTVPVFIGDDETDEAGFAVARELNGHAILIGPQRPTVADFGISSPPVLRDWLWEAVRLP